MKKIEAIIREDKLNDVKQCKSSRLSFFACAQICFDTENSIFWIGPAELSKIGLVTYKVEFYYQI